MYPPYRPVVPTPEQRLAILSRVDRGEIVLESFRIDTPAFPDDLIPRIGGRAVLGAMWTYDAPERCNAGDRSEFDERPEPWKHHPYYWTGMPNPAQLVECECDCDCSFLGRFDEVVWRDGMLRCRTCLGVGHPPRLRRPADGDA